MNTAPTNDAWKEVLRSRLPLLGHRNWVVVADAAYPWQIAPGLETITADAEALVVVTETLDILKRSGHLQPVVCLDAELEHVAEGDAPGISDYRNGIRQIMAGRTVEASPHESIIRMLDEAGRHFKVLIIKTGLALPYTSIFIRLECGYWSSDAEERLRQSMRSSRKPRPVGE